MSTEKRPLKVFLCHASADKQKVRELYRYLRKRGIKPWFDEIDLVGGQDWQVEIPKALATSDAIIICLTKNSVDKEGYIQKEIKFALDKALEMPEGRIFLIPVRFEECEVPFSLSRYQWVDLFDEAGYSRMMRALKFRASQLRRADVEVTSQPSIPLLKQEDNTGVENARHEKDTQERKVPERAEHEKAEKATPDNLEREEDERTKRENAARENAKRDPTGKTAITTTLNKSFTALKSTLSQANPFVRIAGLLGIVVVVLFWVSLWAMPKLFSPVPTATVTSTKSLVSPSSLTTSTATPTITNTVAPSPTPTKDLATDIEQLAYFEIDSDKQCKLVFVNSEKDKLSCPDSSPSITRFFSWSPNGQFAVIFNQGSYSEKLYGFVDWTFGNIWVYLQPVDQEKSFLLKSFSRDYTFGGIYWSDSSKLFYKLYENGLNKVFLFDIGSQTETAIAKSPSGIGSYDISPDGTKIAYASSPGGHSNIFVQDIQSGNITSVIDFEINYVTYVRWIANDIVLFIKDDDEIYTISILDKVVKSIGKGQFLGISPDRTKLALYSEVLRIYDFASNGLIDFSGVELKGPYLDSFWSPNSRHLGLTENNRVSVFDLDTETINVISGEFENPYNLVWSYDGDKIAFVATKNDVSVVFVAKSDGSQVIKVNSENNAFAPAWINPE